MECFDILSGINWLAIIVVTVFSFILGALWHSPVLFGKIWAKEINRDSNQKVNFKLIFGLSALANFATIVALAVFIGKNATLFDGFLKGLMVSIFWVSSSMAVTYLFASRSLKLFLIDAGFYVVFLSIAGMVIGLW